MKGWGEGGMSRKVYVRMGGGGVGKGMKDHVKNARYSNYRDIKYLGSHGLGRIVRGR